MSTKKKDAKDDLKDAIGFYFNAVIDSDFIDTDFDRDGKLEVTFHMTPQLLGQMFCFAGQFDDARQARETEDNVVVFIDSRKTRIHEGPPDDASLHDGIIGLFDRTIRQQYDYVVSVLKSMENALEGPGEMIVWSKQVGSISVELKVESDYLGLGDMLINESTEQNWSSLVYCHENPYYFCTTFVSIEDDELGEIGNSALGLCTIPTDTSSDRFTWSILKDYGSDLLREATHEARAHKPKVKKAMPSQKEVAHG